MRGTYRRYPRPIASTPRRPLRRRYPCCGGYVRLDPDVTSDVRVCPTCKARYRVWRTTASAASRLTGAPVERIVWERQETLF